MSPIIEQIIEAEEKHWMKYGDGPKYLYLGKDKDMEYENSDEIQEFKRNAIPDPTSTRRMYRGMIVLRVLDDPGHLRAG